MVTASYAHVGITCKDPLAIERFYTKHFGFKRARLVPLGADEQIVFIKSGEVYLELFQAKAEAPMPAPQADGYPWPGLRHLAFAVEDVDAKLAEVGAEARVTLGPADFDAWIPGWRGAWIADPEGNIVELSQGYKDEEPAQPVRAAAGPLVP